MVRRALEAAVDRQRSDEPADADPADGRFETTLGQRQADALGLIAESALAADLDRGSAGDRYQVVLHVDADTLRADAEPAAPDVPAETRPDGAAAPDVPAETQRQGHAAIEDADGLRVSAETARRMACDASAVIMPHAADGSILDVGRKTRAIPPALGRALRARDRGCRFPGCTGRRCDAHHIDHWADGGRTALDNLVLLCRRHHRAVHEEGFRVEVDAGGEVSFRRPDGRALPSAPAAPRWTGQPLAPTAARLTAAGIAIGPATATPHWHGERLDLGYAIDVLWTRPRPAGPLPRGPGPAGPACCRRRAPRQVRDVQAALPRLALDAFGSPSGQCASMTATHHSASYHLRQASRWSRRHPPGIDRLVHYAVRTGQNSCRSAAAREVLRIRDHRAAPAATARRSSPVPSGSQCGHRRWKIRSRSPRGPPRSLRTATHRPTGRDPFPAGRCSGPPSGCSGSHTPGPSCPSRSSPSPRHSALPRTPGPSSNGSRAGCCRCVC